ncbi:MAG: hypothetical protein RI900_359 [Actinomycetota bacterium]|jgi:hypothetical protein
MNDEPLPGFGPDELDPPSRGRAAAVVAIAAVIVLSMVFLAARAWWRGSPPDGICNLVTGGGRGC